MKFYYLLFLFPFAIFSQELSEKAQLQSAIDTSKTVKVKVQLYTDLAWEYINEESDSALIIAEKALEFSKKNKYPLGQAIAIETKGLYHEIVTGNNDLASSHYFKAIKICEDNNLNYISSIYHSLGVLFHTSDNYEKAKAYYTIAYKKALDDNDISLQKKCLINLGSVNSSLKNYAEAKALLLKSLELDVKKNLDYDTYANLGNIYMRQKDYEQALPFFEKAIQQDSLNPGSENNLRFLIDAKTALKDSSFMQPYIERAIVWLNSNNQPRETSIMTMALSNYYRTFRDYEKAFYFRDEYLKLYEDIKEKQRDETVFELEAKYKTEQTKAMLKQKEKEQRFYSVLSIIGLGIAVAFAILFYKNRKKKIILSKQAKLLEATIDEKNILLKETHHRVKNSFQIVSSLLYLQSENMEDKEAKVAIKEAENRVRSMVLIHQKLYNKDQLVGIDSKEYFNDLVNDIFESHQFQEHSLNYKLDLESLILDVETITPIGLILNELIINVLKHAFPKVESSSFLKIDFKHMDDSLVLRVVDNGKGLENDIKDTSFGIKLMKALSKKLKATLEFKSENGTEAVLTIKKFNIL